MGKLHSVVKLNPACKTSRRELLELLFLFSSFAFPALFIAGLFVLQYPDWWKWLVYEQVPLTWLESSLLLGSSLFALINFIFCFYGREKNSRYWLALAFAFAAFAFDERFAMHERIRDSLLAPAGIKIPFLPWISPGDFLLLIPMAAGLIMLPGIIRLFKADRKTRLFFIAAVCLSASAVLMDTADMAPYSQQLQRTEQFIEEILETAAMACFLDAFFLSLSVRIFKSFKND